MTIRLSPADVVQFTRESAERISNAVREFELEPLPGSPLTFGAPLSDTRQRKVFRICTFTAAWSKNATKVVTLKYNTSTPNTFVAMNLFAEIASSTATRNCAIAKEGTAWYLIAAEC